MFTSGQASFVAASYALNLANLTGCTVCVEWSGNSMKASPGEHIADILKRFDSGAIIPEVVMQDDIKLNTDHKPGEGKIWIGKPDPGYQGETRQVVPFDNFEEGER